MLIILISNSIIKLIHFINNDLILEEYLNEIPDLILKFFKSIIENP